MRLVSLSSRFKRSCFASWIAPLIIGLAAIAKLPPDVRVVAATNRNLRQEVSAGRFRKDLYHRLSQFELCVPPLRDRPADIVALAEHLLAQDGSGLQFSQKALMVLQSYAWPGNVRELQNTVNKVIFSASSATIDESEVRQELTNADAIEEDNYEASDSETRLVNLEAQLKSQAIQKALENTGGHRGQAAAQLGISRRTLSRKLRDYGLSSRRSSAPAYPGIIAGRRAAEVSRGASRRSFAHYNGWS